MRRVLIIIALLAAAWPLAAQTNAAQGAPPTFTTEICIDTVGSNTITYMESRVITIDDPANFAITDCTGLPIASVGEIPYPSRARITFRREGDRRIPLSLEILIVYQVNPATDKLRAVRWNPYWDDYVAKQIH